jgi:vacuolar protein sorting-associated protein 35
LIQAELGGEEACGPDVEAYYAATVRHIKRKKLEGGEVGARYEAIDV